MGIIDNLYRPISEILGMKNKSRLKNKTKANVSLRKIKPKKKNVPRPAKTITKKKNNSPVILSLVSKILPKKRQSKAKRQIVNKNANVKVKVAETKLLEIGEITHFFSKISVVVLKVTKNPVAVNDRIMIKGISTNFAQEVDSLQVESVDVKSAKKGQLVGLKVIKPAKEKDKVYKIIS